MRWKWFVAVGVPIIVVLIAGICVYLNTYDYNKLKPLVARMVENATGRKQSLDGEVNLEIGFAPALVVTNVALANVSWGSQPQMIEIERLQARVRLLPLLVKDLDIKYIRLASAVCTPGCSQNAPLRYPEYRTIGIKTLPLNSRPGRS